MSAATRKANRERIAKCRAEHRPLVPWDCFCTFGCDCCSYHFECPDCHQKFTALPASQDAKGGA